MESSGESSLEILSSDMIYAEINPADVVTFDNIVKRYLFVSYHY